MNVLHLISSNGFFGAENVLIELSRELLQTEYYPFVGVFKNLHNPHLEVAEKAEMLGIPVKIFPCKGKLDLKTVFSLRKFIVKKRIKILHTHGYKSNLYALTASAGKNVLLFTTCHNWLGKDLKMKFYARIDKFFLNRFDRVIAVSDPVREEILLHNIHPHKVFTIYNGINLNRFNHNFRTDFIRKEFSISGDCKVIGTVGRLTEEKGHIYLLQAAEMILRKHPETIFLIVGDGPLRQDLEMYAKSICPQSAIIFTGVRDDMPELYSIMDIFVLPSLTEGLPMALLEAMASKKPVIATRVGAVPGVVQDGFSGYLVNPCDVNGLINTISALLENPQKALDISQNAYETVKKHFSSRVMAEKYRQLYREAIEGK